MPFFFFFPLLILPHGGCAVFVVGGALTVSSLLDLYYVLQFGGLSTLEL